MSNKSGVSSQVISLPKGGGALQGLGEKFAPDLHTGTGNLSIPLPLPPGRNGFQPQLSLVYSTGNGNGPFGLGWSLSIPGISRSTSKGIPRYRDDEDTFVLSGAEDLVPVGGDSTFTRYRPRTEGLFARIDHHKISGPNGVSNYWEVSSKDGLVSRYGTPRPEGATSDWRDPAAVLDPDGSEQCFAWKLTRTTDPFGNRIEYVYERELEQEDGPHRWDQVYLSEVRYIDYGSDPENPQFLVAVRFCYEADRPDPFSEYRAGFEVRTTRRCTRIEIYTADPQTPARALELTYLDQLEIAPEALPLNGVSLLARLQLLGYDGSTSESLPPLELGYTTFDPRSRRFQKCEAMFGDMPPRALNHSDFELVDLFGNGLPSVVQMGEVMRYWRNLGGGRFQSGVQVSGAPAGARLADSGVQMADLDGDGRVDLLITDGVRGGYYPLSAKGGWDWERFVSYKQLPSINLEHPEVRLVDLDGDGITDALRTGTALELYYHDRDEGWTQVERLARRDAEDFPNVSFSDSRVKLADMTGDGLQDIVLIQNGSIEYWPTLGYGRWGRRVRMTNSPRFEAVGRYSGEGYDVRRLLVGDVDGDGLADLVYVDDGRVTVWLNQSGNGWSEPVTIHGTPPVSDLDAVRLVDLLGNGTAGILWTYDRGTFHDSSYKFLDLTGGTKPYLLNRIDNHLGALTIIEYAPSTRFYLEDQRQAATRWKTSLPFPVQVVARVEVIDRISRGKLTTEYRYHHGYWDGVDREFRGFGRVDQRDTESFEEYHSSGLHDSAGSFEGVATQHFSPPTETRTWFHQGSVGGRRASWTELDLSDEFWTGDIPFFSRAEGLDDLLRTLSGTDRRDAIRTLRGRVLRTELYAMDGSERQTRPYTVTEQQHTVTEAVSVEGTWESPSGEVRVFFPQTVATRTTQWERGDEPMTQLSFTGDFDVYGQPRRQTAIAVPRGRDYRVSGPAGEPYLATTTTTYFAQRNDTQRYIADRVARTTTLEAVNDGSLAALELLIAIETSQTSLQVIDHTLHFYDGDAFTSSLDSGELGDYGARVRTERLVMTRALLEDVYRSGDAVLVPAEIPPYLVTGEPVPWTDEYPQGFRDGLTGLAGYVWQDGSGNSPYHAGYYAVTEQRGYDFQLAPAVPVRGLVLATRDPLGRETSIQYDSTYSLLPVEVIDPVGLTILAGYDLRVLQPAEITDVNGNRTAYAYTPLGLLERVAVMGKEGEEAGDTLDEPGTLFQYEFLAFDNSSEEDPQPIHVHVVRRQQHRWDLIHEVNDERAANSLSPLTPEEIEALFPENEVDTYPERFIQSRIFSDGFGRQLQTRTQGEAVVFDDPTWGDSGLPGDISVVPGSAVGQELEPGTVRVVVSGWQTYDNKGRVVEKYEPFFGMGWAYEAATEEALGQKVSMYYEPRGRLARTLNPDGSEQRVVYGIPGDLSEPDIFTPTAWEQYTYDANDNAGRTHASAAGEYQSHWDTPSSAQVDALGKTVRTVVRAGADPESEWYTTRMRHDIRGNVLSVTDELNRVVFRYGYDLLNRQWRVENIDAGVRRSVLGPMGSMLEQRDSRGSLRLQSYDPLDRSLFLWARDGGAGTVSLRERLEYGDGSDPEQLSADRDAAAAANQLACLVRHYDEAGRVTLPGYDFKGNMLEKVRQLLSDEELLTVFEGAASNGWQVPAYRVDWEPPEGITLEAYAEDILEGRMYETSQRFDALNRVVSLRYPTDVRGGRKELLPRYNRAGAVEGITLDGYPYVERIAYNARGQRILAACGNGVMTRYAYDPQTYRLTRQRSECYQLTNGSTYEPVRPGRPFQDVGYGYDLAGNPLVLEDRTPGCGVKNNPDALLTGNLALATLLAAGDALIRELEYDPLYRLVRATGRESGDISSPRGWGDERRRGYNSGNHGTPNQSNAPFLTRVYEETYDYDAAGNMVRLRHDAGGNLWTRHIGIGELSPEDWEAAWTSHVGDGPEWEDAPGNRLTYLGSDEASSNPSHAYDVNGNLVEEDVIRHYEWDHGNRLKVFRVQSSGAEPSIYAMYLYDASGQRLKKMVRKQGGQLIEGTVYIDEVYEHHYHIRGNITRENNTLHVMDGRTRVTLVRVGAPFREDISHAVQYVLGDYLQTSLVVVDGKGDWVNREEFSPYGETLFGSYARKRYRFTGKERDEESGLSYHRARYCAPWLCRWLTCDPEGAADGLNLYVYAGDNPCRYSDSNGTTRDSDLYFKAPEPSSAPTSTQSVERLGKLGAPVGVLKIALESSWVTSFDFMGDKYMPPSNVLNLTSQTMKALERFGTGGLTVGIGTLYHEATHAYFDRMATNPKVESLIRSGTQYYQSAPLKSGGNVTDPGRVFQEAAGMYVGTRASTWASTYEMIARALSYETPEKRVEALQAFQIREKYEAGTADLTHGYEPVGFLGTSGQDEVTRPISQEMKAFLDSAILENKVPDRFDDVPLFREMIHQAGAGQYYETAPKN